MRDKMQFDRDSKIAFLGMGLMGSRMATRLLKAGFELQSGTARPVPAILCLHWEPLRYL